MKRASEEVYFQSKTTDLEQIKQQSSMLFEYHYEKI